MSFKTVSLVGAGALLLILAFTAIGTLNDYSEKETTAAARQEDCKNVLDNVRKTVRETASLTDKQMEMLETIVVSNAKARTGDDPKGEIFYAVQEAVPTVDTKILEKVANTISSARNDWRGSQTALIDVKREGDLALKRVPGGIILKMFGRKPIDITVITSAETKENYRTGEDNESWVPAKTTKPVEK